MVTSAFRTFSEPDQFAAAIRPAQVQTIATRPGRYAARLSLVDLDHVGLRTFEANLPQLSRAALAPETLVLSFLLQSVGGMYVAGQELRHDTVIQNALGRDTYNRTIGPTILGHLLVPISMLDSIARNVGASLLTLRDTHAIDPLAQALSRLRRLHNAATRLALDAPEILSRSGAVHGLEQALIEAVSDCFAGTEPQPSPFWQRKQEAVMRCFNELLEEHWDESLFIPEICEKLGVSAHSFRAYCLDYLGMGPKRFLLLRRMHMVRRRLIEADADRAAITEVATEYGFWELGRFAGQYKQLFGESPSATLRRPPTASPRGRIVESQHGIPVAG